jgi:hypothetical protein
MIKKCCLILSIITVFLFTAATVQAEAVLVIVKAEMSPQFPQPGGQVTVTFTIGNIGDQDAPGRTSLGVEIYSSNKQGNRIAGDYIKAIPWYTNNIEPIQKGTQQTISTTVTLNKEGLHTTSGVIITEGYTIQQVRVARGNDKKIFSVVRPADLVLSDIRMNHQGRLILTMYNAGAAIPDEHFQAANIRVKVAAGTFTVPLKNAATKLLQLPGKPILPGIGSLYRINYIWAATGGSGIILSPNLQNKVEATIDFNQSIFDKNRANNTKIVWVGGKPDLVVCFKKLNHNKPNQNAYYPPIVKNIGYAPSTPSKLRFWIEDDGVKTYNIPALAPNEEYKGVQRKVYWIRVKNHKFRLTADNNNDVEEFDEYNNIIEGIITVGKYGNNSRTLCSDAPGMTGYN